MKTKAELLARTTDIKARISEIDAQYQGQYIDPESTDGQEWNSLNAEYDETLKIVGQMNAREERIQQLDKEGGKADESVFMTSKPGAVRGADIYDLSTVRSNASSPDGMRAELHERALRAVDAASFPHEKADEGATKAHLERLLATTDDDNGSLARRLLATGSPVYKRAFGKSLMGQPLQGSEMSALSLGSGGGDYAVPFTLDPTLTLTSDGAVNPLRAISKIVQIVDSNEWKGLSTAGVTAHRRKEGEETADGSPTITQPTVTVTKADVFVPFSTELQQDWPAMQAELAVLIQDAKDVEEAESFIVGNGEEDNPPGLLTGATEVVKTGEAGAFASTDLDKMEEALGNRFQQRAQWVGNRSIYNLIRHFASNNGPDLWVRIADPLAQGGNTGRTLLGYAANEASAMKTTHATKDKFLALGDFSKFLIVDRIGMSIELVPHLFGENGRPTGERGFYAYWRNTCKVLVPKAFRVLEAS